MGLAGQVNEARFGPVKEALMRKYRNTNMRPEQHANYLRLFALRTTMWHCDAVLAELETLTPQAVQVYSCMCCGLLLHRTP